jgi:hypothetical protein
MSTLGNDAYGLSRIKIWLQMFITGDLSCSDLPHTGRPPIILGPQVEALLQKYPFASAFILTKHFLTNVFIVKEILQRELGRRKVSRRGIAHSLSDA